MTDESAATEPEPVVMTIYTLHMYRESRPSLPMFGEHVMCGFVQVGGADRVFLHACNSLTYTHRWTSTVRDLGPYSQSLRLGVLIEDQCLVLDYNE